MFPSLQIKKCQDSDTVFDLSSLGLEPRTSANSETAQYSVLDGRDPSEMNPQKDGNWKEWVQSGILGMEVGRGSHLTAGTPVWGEEEGSTKKGGDGSGRLVCHALLCTKQIRFISM